VMTQQFTSHGNRAHGRAANAEKVNVHSCFGRCLLQ
jgi:hypothetical protein